MLASDAQIQEQELYRMAHSIKGTAGTIDLPEWYSESLRLLMTFKENGKRVFDHDQLVTILEPLCQMVERSDLTPASQETEHLEQPYPSRSSVHSVLRAPKAGTVLIIDDDIGLLTLLKDELESQNFMVLATIQPEKGLSWFYDMRPDCVVLDLVLPGMNGFELLSQIQELCERHFIPVMIVSASSNKETRMQSYAMGAEDFMAKPFDLDEFSLHIRKLTSKRRKMTELLLVDSVTGAYSMPFLERELQRYQEQSRIQDIDVSLIAVDLQGMRNYNETHSFAQGDLLLRQLSDAIKSSLRLEDIWAHERGGRFYLLQPGISSDQSRSFLNNVLRSPEVASLLSDDTMRIRYGMVPVAFTVDRSELFDQVHQQILNMDTVVKAQEPVGSTPQISSYTSSVLSGHEPLRLAIIDDDPLIRNILQRQMVDLEQEYSLDIRVYADGKEFLSDPWHNESARYLLILDRMMPRINGMEVLARLRSESTTNDLNYTVLMLTGVDDEQGITEAIRAGADDYMTKPFSMMELEARVRRLLGKVGATL